jgi:Rab-GTPase-TBC domain
VDEVIAETANCDRSRGMDHSHPPSPLEPTGAAVGGTQIASTAGRPEGSQHESQQPSRHIRIRTWRQQLGLLPLMTTPSECDEQERRCNELQERDFDRLVKMYPFPEENEGKHSVEASSSNDHHSSGNGNGKAGAEAAPPNVGAALDPLSAIVQEEELKSTQQSNMDLEYRMEMARQKKNGSSKRIIPAMEEEAYDVASAAFQIIERDLVRLPAFLVEGTNGDSIRRVQILRRVLFTYTCHHPEPGYRQGMHEVAAFILRAYEVDYGRIPEVFSDESSTEKCDGNSRELPNALLPVASMVYSILVSLLAAILPTYDSSGPSGPLAATPHGQPLPQISRNVVSLVQQYDNTDQLVAASLSADPNHQYGARRVPNLITILTEINTPPQLFLMRWLRLLFSREMKVPATQVLSLWDYCFSWSARIRDVLLWKASWSTSPQQHRQPDPASVQSDAWMLVLETMAAARILLHRNSILQAAVRGSLVSPGAAFRIDTSETVHLLMNLPPEHESIPLLAVASQMLDHYLYLNFGCTLAAGPNASISSPPAVRLPPIPSEFLDLLRPVPNQQHIDGSPLIEEVTATLANKWSIATQKIGQATFQARASIKSHLLHFQHDQHIPTPQPGNVGVSSDPPFMSSVDMETSRKQSPKAGQSSPQAIARMLPAIMSSHRSQGHSPESNRNFDDPFLSGITWGTSPSNTVEGVAEARHSVAGTSVTDANAVPGSISISSENDGFDAALSSTLARDRNLSVAVRMRHDIGVLHDFVVSVQARGSSTGVPPSVWAALGDLEELQRGLC